MAFISRDLSVLAYADGYTLWHYTTEDAVRAVRHAGYFDEARDIFRNQDRIEVIAGDGDFDARLCTIGRVKLRR